MATEQMSWQQIVDLADSIGMRQWQLAQRLGVSPSMVSYWLAGIKQGNERRPEAEKIVRAEAKVRKAELAKL